MKNKDDLKIVIRPRHNKDLMLIGYFEKYDKYLSITENLDNSPRSEELKKVIWNHIFKE